MNTYQNGPLARINFKIDEFDTYYEQTITDENRRYFHPISELSGIMFKFSIYGNKENVLEYYDFKGVDNWVTLSIITLERAGVEYDNVQII